MEHLFRQQSGKMSAILIRIFGFQHSELVEDIIQETFLTAMKTWPVKGEPENPEAWLMLVAKNKLINEMKRIRRHAEKNQEAHLEKAEEQIDELFLDHEVRDSQLRLLFACCDPLLKPRVQIMLTLKVLSGFSDAEIASALLNTKEGVKKAIYRAKLLLRDRYGDQMGIPFQHEVMDRLDTVLTIIYLIFNEGYKRSHSDEVISEDLCYEAFRLAKLMLELEGIDQGKVHALLALMMFAMARFEARLNHEGEMIDLENQDRSRWDEHLIGLGMKHLKASRQSTELSRYHLESSIASIHSMAPSFEETRWKDIVNCYRLLMKLDASDVVRMNYAIALSKLEGPASGLRELAKIDETSSGKRALIYASRAAMNMQLGFFGKAKSYYQVALDYSESQADKKFIQNKIMECDTKNMRTN